MKPEASELSQIDKIAFEFEQQWSQGRNRSVQDFYRLLESDQLFRELMLVELELCVRAGKKPDLEAYLRKFPDRRELVVELVDKVSQMELESQDAAETGSTIKPSRKRTRESDADSFPAIPDFEIVSTIGEGGMGVVYRAKQKSLNRIVALKMIRSGLFASQTEVLRFQNEAEAIAKLSHSGIISVFSFEKINGHHFLVMPFVSGESLEQLIQQGPIEPRQAATLVVAIANAMEYAHGQGVIHRDLKPSNIMLDDNGTPLVFDFGLARNQDSDLGLTETGQPVGTPGYMSPEQARGDLRQIDERTDVYGIGAILYSLLTGNPPFQAPTPSQTIQQVLEKEVVSPRVFQPSIDRDIETIVLTSLDKNRSSRYGSAGAMESDLHSYLNGKPIKARRHSVSKRAYRWCIRNPLLMAILALIVMILAGTVFALVQYYSAQIQIADADRRRVLAENSEAEERANFESENRVARIYQTREAFKALWDKVMLGYSSTPVLEPVDKEMAGFGMQLVTSILGKTKSSRKAIVFGHHEIIDAQVSSDGSLVAAVDASGLVSISSARTETLIRTLTDPAYREDRGQHVHYLTTLTQQKSDPGAISSGSSMIVAICWSHNDQFVFAGTMQGEVIRVDVETGAQTRLFKCESPLFELVLSPSSKEILAGSADGKVYALTEQGKLQKVYEIGRSPISCLRHFGAADHLVGGTESGKLFVIDNERRTVDAAVVALENEIWDVRPVLTNEEYEFWTGAEESTIGVWTWKPTRSNPLRRVRELTFDCPLSTVHSINVDDKRKKLTVLDSDGRVCVFATADDGNSKLLHQFEDTLANSQLRYRLNDAISAGIQIPLPFRRKGTLLPPDAVPDDDSRFDFILAGSNAEIEFFRLPAPDISSVSRMIHLPTAKPVKIVFDPVDDSRIWALQSGGQLTYVNTDNGKILSQVMAHGDQAGVLFVAGKRICTTGQDGKIRCWGLKEDKIVERDDWKLEGHNLSLLDLIFDSHRNYLLAIDEQSQLVIWDLAEGTIMRRIEVDEEKRSPMHGAIAISWDGKKLIVCAAGQIARVFSMDDFEFQRDQATVGGRGAVAACWSPKRNDRFLVVDLERIRPHRLLNRQNLLARHPTSIATRSEFRQACPTPDNRRIGVLDSSGVIYFFDAETQILVSWFRCALRSCRDIAFDQSGFRMAVSNDEGQIEILDTRKDREAPPRSRWIIDEKSPVVVDSITVAASAEREIFWSRSCSALDSDDNLHVVYVMYPRQRDYDSKVLRNDQEGQLFYATGGFGKKVTVEKIAVDHSDADKRIDIKSPGIAVVHRNVPIISFRRRIPDARSRYSGDAYLATRKPDGWKFRRYIKQENMGFYPAIVVNREKNQVERVFHYSFDKYDLWTATPSAIGGGESWDHQRIGIRGDGVVQNLGRRNNEEYRFVTYNRRFGGDGARPVLFRQHKKGVDRVRADSLTFLTVNPDGRVFGLQRGANDQNWLVEFQNDEWKRVRKLGSDFGNGLREFFVTQQNSIVALYFLRQHRQLVLAEEAEDAFVGKIIKEYAKDQVPNRFRLLMDKKGEPLLIVARTYARNGFIQMLKLR